MMRVMNRSVLHVIESAGTGGAQYAMELMLIGLKARGWNVAACLPFDGALVDRLQAHGITCHPLPISRRLDTRAGVTVAELIRRNRFGIVHVHTPKAGMLVRGPAHFAGAKVIMHVHGLGTHALLEHLPMGPLERVKKTGLILFERIADISTDRFILECETDFARGFYPAKKCSIVNNGIDPAVFLFDDPPAAQPPRIVFPARLSVQKDPETLVRALRLLKDRGVPALVELAGDGERRAEMVALTQELGLTESVVFLDGARRGADIYRPATIVALTTHFEGQPFAILEAMSVGRAIVATACGGIPETLGDAGVTVPHGDPNAVADALERLLKDETIRRDLARRARQRLEENFTLNKMLNGVEAVYENL